MLNEMFTDFIICSDKQIQNIYRITKKNKNKKTKTKTKQNKKNQSDSQHWTNHRKGRLTASKTEKPKSSDSMTYLDILALVMGYTASPQTWQMKHRSNSEL